MQYYVYRISPDGRKYLSAHETEAANLLAGVDRRKRKTFDTFEDAQSATQYLTAQHRVPHYIEKAILTKPIGVHGFCCYECGKTILPGDHAVVHSDTGEVFCYHCATLERLGY